MVEVIDEDEYIDDEDDDDHENENENENSKNLQVGK